MSPGIYTADEVDGKLAVKADLVDGKVPAGQLPPGGSGDMVASVYDPAAKQAQVATESELAAKTTLTEVKADSDIADALQKKHASTLDHSNSLDHSNGLDHDGGAQDTAIAGKLATSAFAGLTKITVGTSQPGTPGVGDLWIDIN